MFAESHQDVDEANVGFDHAQTIVGWAHADDHKSAHLWTQHRHVHAFTQAAGDRDTCDC